MDQIHSTHPEDGEKKVARYVWAVVRLCLGFTFLWAFADKLFGLGRGTESAKAWLNGGSPTTGFLKGAAGTFAGPFNSIAGAPWADWLFMIGLFGLGIALIAGVGLRVVAATGGLLLVFMWAASLPLDNNPFMDDHLVYAVVLAGLALAHAGDTLGLGKWWGATATVKRFPALQ
jgi:thiosulfate dehydrogenase [quinone] large subunit